MEVAVHPDFAKNGWIYLAYADEHMSEGKSYGMTKLIRGQLKSINGVLSYTNKETIFEAKPEHYLPTDVHFGCRIAFDPKDSGILFFSIGERGRAEMAQDLKRPNGKVHRIADDGTIPADNPFNTPEQIAAGTYASIWSYGHRNPQGLAFDLEGNLWDTEHGPRGGDELNIVLKGKNYGWPIVAFSMNYNGQPWTAPWPDVVKPGDAKAAEIEMPKDRWLPSIGASGLDVVKTGPAGISQWTGDMIAGGLSGSNVDRLRYKDGKVIEHEELLNDSIRVRGVRAGPDGSIYVVYNEPANTIVRLVPAK